MILNFRHQLRVQFYFTQSTHEVINEIIKMNWTQASINNKIFMYLEQLFRSVSSSFFAVEEFIHKVILMPFKHLYIYILEEMV